MTEDEAKEKVCPIGKMRGSFDGNWDTGPCIGSACMLWRAVPGTPAIPIVNYRTIPSSAGGEIPAGPGGGYCGLGPKP